MRGADDRATGERDPEVHGRWDVAMFAQTTASRAETCAASVGGGRAKRSIDDLLARKRARAGQPDPPDRIELHVGIVRTAMSAPTRGSTSRYRAGRPRGRARIEALCGPLGPSADGKPGVRRCRCRCGSRAHDSSAAIGSSVREETRFSGGKITGPASPHVFTIFTVFYRPRDGRKTVPTLISSANLEPARGENGRKW